VRRGFAFAPPSDYFSEFEAAFPFEETPHQEAAITDVIGDMINPRPMDRLVCGDVGFGKTEVAMRAAFLAVLSGKQVAVLVPTTILAEQHGRTFAERFRGTPVIIETLSRFRSAKDQKEILANLTDGKVDIVIGTHRILSRDVEIPRLGLSAIVAEGVDTGTLRRAVGHDPGTALPGRPGNVVLAGHRDTFFRALRAVRPLDLVTITTPDGVFDYQVDEVSIVDADRLDIVAPAAEPMLTLITCYPFHFVGPAPRRFIVHARPAVARQSAARDGVTERHERATGLPVARRSS